MQDAKITNLRIRENNRHLAAIGQDPVPIVKQVAGVGHNLPGANVVVANVPAVQVGQPSPAFPQTHAAIFDMGAGQLSRLAIQYNEQFGILVDDDEATRRFKFWQWVQY